MCVCHPAQPFALFINLNTMRITATHCVRGVQLRTARAPACPTSASPASRLTPRAQASDKPSIAQPSTDSPTSSGARLVSTTAHTPGPTPFTHHPTEPPVEAVVSSLNVDKEVSIVLLYAHHCHARYMHDPGDQIRSQRSADVCPKGLWRCQKPSLQRCFFCNTTDERICVYPV